MKKVISVASTAREYLSSDTNYGVDGLMGRDEWLYVYSDGGSRGNPGPAGIGGLAKTGKDEVLVEVCEYIGTATNNVAEYQALIRILEECRGLVYKNIKIRTDSELVANQVKGLYKVKSKNVIPMVARVRSLLEPYREVQVMSIPRNENAECDKLANIAIDGGLRGEKEPRPPDNISETQEGLF